MAFIFYFILTTVLCVWKKILWQIRTKYFPGIPIFWYFCFFEATEFIKSADQNNDGKIDVRIIHFFFLWLPKSDVFLLDCSKNIICLHKICNSLIRWLFKENFIFLYFFINYDDICYSTGECRSPYFNLIQIPEWSLILAASYNAVEVGVIGSEDQQQKWRQWLLPDSGRAELPLKANSDERYAEKMLTR